MGIRLIPLVFRASPPLLFFSPVVKPLSVSTVVKPLSAFPPPSSAFHVLASAPRSLPSVNAESDARVSLPSVNAESDSRVSLPDLTVKEKKELASYAHSLGDKLKSQQIGKSGVTANVFFALNETFEANELLKLKIHRSCPGELDDIINQLEQGTASVAVAQIGRTVIFYRPSLSKLKAVEKKKQTRKLFMQRNLLQGSREPRPSRRGI